MAIPLNNPTFQHARTERGDRLALSVINDGASYAQRIEVAKLKEAGFYRNTLRYRLTMSVVTKVARIENRTFDLEDPWTVSDMKAACVAVDEYMQRHILEL